jgi:hypothetical protein
MTSVLRGVEWDHDLVAFARSDLVVATGTPVGLLGLVRLHVPYIDPGAVVGGGLGPVVFRPHATTVTSRL